jgi:hypothetical protein
VAEYAHEHIEALSEDALMFATDYPHTESWFPKSVEAVLGWPSISETARRKLLWDNAVLHHAPTAAGSASAWLPVSGHWRRARAAMLAVLTGLNGLNYLDRYADFDPPQTSR